MSRLMAAIAHNQGTADLIRARPRRGRGFVSTRLARRADNHRPLGRRRPNGCFSFAPELRPTSLRNGSPRRPCSEGTHTRQVHRQTFPGCCARTECRRKDGGERADSAPARKSAIPHICRRRVGQDSNLQPDGYKRPAQRSSYTYVEFLYRRSEEQ